LVRTKASFQSPTSIERKRAEIFALARRRRKSVAELYTRAERLRELEAERDRLREALEEVAYFGDALIAREYEPGSPTVVAFVMKVRAALGSDAEDECG
jgi:hypothetical protein